MFKCSCHRMKCDRGAGAWHKFEDITHQCFSYQCSATCAAKDKHGVRESLAKAIFFQKMFVSAWKNLEQPSYICILNIHLWCCIAMWLRNRAMDSGQVTPHGSRFCVSSIYSYHGGGKSQHKVPRPAKDGVAYQVRSEASVVQGWCTTEGETWA